MEQSRYLKYKLAIGVLLFAVLLCIGKIVIDNGGSLTEPEQNTAKQEETAELSVSADYTVMNQEATINVCTMAENGLKALYYQKGKVESLSESDWESAVDITENQQFKVHEKGDYSILAEDEAGNRKVTNVSVVMEMRAVWIYYLEYQEKAKSLTGFQQYITETFDRCKEAGMNTVVFQVRPCADAMYLSSYFPWSVYAAGKAGKNPGFDPLQIAVREAHKRNLSIHAWVNPYRITLNTTKLSYLPKDSIARKWASKKSTKRNVLSMNGALYFNPASAKVQELVANGVKEIVQNYQVDGIHMDDYFYPNLGTKTKQFDYKEYKKYRAACRKNKISPKSLVSWRRNNVNAMVKKVYAAVKKINPDCLFGISPAGNLSNLYSSNAYFSPVKLWMNSSSYIDYICPQIYWSFKQKTAPYKKVLKQWTDIKRSDNVSLYIGLAGYRAGISKKEAKLITDTEWAESNTVLKRQLQYARKTKKVDGMFLFASGSLKDSRAKKEIKNLKSVINLR